MFFLAKIAAVVAVHAVTLSPVTYTVQPGDTLSTIAARQCGNARDWTGIYEHSKSVIGSNPNLIYPGQKLKIVCTDPASLLPLASPTASQTVHPAPAASDGDGDHDGDTSDATAPVMHSAPTQSTHYSGISGSFQACVIQRESGGDPGAVNPASGAGGLYGFLPSTWASLGFPGLPENAPTWMQNQAFAKEYAIAGTAPWGPYDGC